MSSSPNKVPNLGQRIWIPRSLHSSFYEKAVYIGNGLMKAGFHFPGGRPYITDLSLDWKPRDEPWWCFWRT